MKKWIFTSIISLCFLSSAAFGSDSSDAKKLIENWFMAMKTSEMDKAGSYLAPQFVSIHTDGKVRDKSQEMKLIKNLKMQDYKLSDFSFSQSGDVIVVTFKDKGTEMIDNKPIAPGAAGRMAVLQKQNKDWLIVAYANMDVIK